VDAAAHVAEAAAEATAVLEPVQRRNRANNNNGE
jgi:hypothetical protein